MTDNSYLQCLNASIGFLPFYKNLASPKMHSALMFSRVQVTHIKLFLFSTQEQRTLINCGLLRFLLISSLP
ncbi:unnamed protein product [Hymenolepis diminuta]|uniref:Uncharacterized protein n=1 Tax=Hymenolepis diminuta TaxID=6216 RepID=A0A564YI23_HYMDI|nr:unnamed protein product [Hymenolepis diminuta]